MGTPEGDAFLPSPWTYLCLMLIAPLLRPQGQCCAHHVDTPVTVPGAQARSGLHPHPLPITSNPIPQRALGLMGKKGSLWIHAESFTSSHQLCSCSQAPRFDPHKYQLKETLLQSCFNPGVGIPCPEEFYLHIICDSLPSAFIKMS